MTEVYVPTPVPKQSEEAPVYIPTPKSYGPKLLTIEEYKARQRPVRPIELPQAPKKKRSRGGRSVKINKQKKELRRLIHISTGEQEKQFYQLKQLDSKRDGRTKIEVS